MANFIVRHGAILNGNDQVAVVHLLQGQGLLHFHRICPTCGSQMTLVVNGQYFDGLVWNCGRPCRKKISIRVGTFFQWWTTVKLGCLTKVMFKWLLGTTARVVSRDTAVSYNLVQRVFRALRLCCTHKLQRTPIHFGGLNHVVEIDESQFNHKQRAHVGRIARNPVWVFGAVDRTHAPAKGFVQIVPNRTRATLVGVINTILNPFSTVNSDMWRGYRNLPMFVPNCIQHDTVNHTQNFVDPVTGAHTQTIESYWNRIKTWLKPKKGVHRHRLQSYLDEWVWKDHYARYDPMNPDHAFDELIQVVAFDYPV